MLYRPSDAYYAEFTTQRLDTGDATNADTLPVATASKNGVDDATFVLTVTNLDAGRYRISGTVPAGYSAGDRVHVSVAATVVGISGKGVVDAFQVIGVNLNDSVRAGLTALPNAVPGGAGGLPTAASGNVVKAVDDSGATLAGAAALTTVGGNVASILDRATTTGMKVQDVDGLTFTSAVEVLLAVIAGKASVSGSTIAFKRRDGSTTKLSFTCAADGERTASVINS